VGLNNQGQCDVAGWTGIIQVAAGGEHTVALKADGTVVALGRNNYGQCNVSGWTDIIQVAAGVGYTAGVKVDGTVVAIGQNDWGQCNVGGWTDIIQVTAGGRHTLGLKADGTVVAAGDNGYEQCAVGGWTDIVQVAAGEYHTLGLKADGTVVAVGSTGRGECNVSGWAGIIQVAAGYGHTVGLETDGTVVATGANEYGQCNVGSWMLFTCRFVNWTGDVGTIGNVNAAVTNITMNGDYSITANFVRVYDLTISSTEGGSVTTPGVGTFTCDEGTVVNLVGEAEEGYCFVNWAGDVGTIANVEAAVTNITMNDNCEITANFGSVYGDYSGILNQVITIQNNLTEQEVADLENDLAKLNIACPIECTECSVCGKAYNYDNYDEIPEGCKGCVAVYNYPSVGWPTANVLSAWYWEDVKDGTPYDSDTIDLNGVNMELGPLYRDGALEILNSNNTPATLTLTGALYVTGDTVIGMTCKDLTLDLNGQTIFVSSSTAGNLEALMLGAKCTIEGPGAIIAVGDIYFAPKAQVTTDPIFVLSVSGTITMQASGNLCGAFAGSVAVEIQQGTTPIITYPEGGFEGYSLNFPY
jgi:hypothetical protein